MILNRIYNCLRYLAPAAAIAVVVLAGGCLTEDGDVKRLPADSGIEFGAAVYEASAARTRTLVPKDITHDYDVDFFVQLDYANSETEEVESSIKRYTVESNYAGRLNAKYSGNRLMWKDATSDHTFYAWTLPWIESADEGESDYADEVDGADSCLEKYYDEDGEPAIVVEFHDSGDGEEFEKYHNNEILEKFIGAQIGPYNYKKQGTYVPLTFYHLVSQIFFDKLIVIRSDGSRQYDLKSNLTFIGMPTTAKFDPHPSKKPVRPHPAEWINDYEAEEHPHHPVVIGPEDGYEPDSELTFFIPEQNEDDRKYHRFYVCPEIDFSELAYKVTITDPNAEEFGIEYYGDFSEVKFERVKGNDYDKADKTDDTVLHAGERMTLSITLHPGVGPGATIVIQDWSTPQPTESSQYAHPGIFTDDAAQRLADATEDEMDELFDLYGEETEDGEKVFKIYENVTVDGDTFSVQGDYVVDGMGHTITMNSSSVTVGAIRDVYITDGTNTVWIDSNGDVHVFDPTTKKFEQTEYNISDKNPSTIDLQTGEVS